MAKFLLFRYIEIVSIWFIYVHVSQYRTDCNLFERSWKHDPQFILFPGSSPRVAPYVPLTTTHNTHTSPSRSWSNVIKSYLYTVQWIIFSATLFSLRFSGALWIWELKNFQIVHGHIALSVLVIKLLKLILFDIISGVNQKYIFSKIIHSTILISRKWEAIFYIVLVIFLSVEALNYRLNFISKWHLMVA